MSKKTPSLALIGVGYWGKNLARNFYQIGALHTLCDAHASHLQTFAAAYPEVQLTTNFQDILDNPAIRQVAIAAPALQHYALAKEALLAGKDVFVEKPLCMCSKEAEELIEIAKQRGRVLMVGHLLHYHAAFQKLKQVIKEGALGPLQYIASHRLNLGSYRVEENALWNFAPHDISMILALCDNLWPESVQCMGGTYLTSGVADMAMTTLRFPGNVRAHIYVSWLHPFKEQKLVVVGSKGMIVFDDTKPWGEKLLHYSGHVSWAQGPAPMAIAVTPEKIDPPAQEPLKEECLHFLECSEKRLTPKTDGNEGLRVLRILEAAQQSMDAEGKAEHPAVPQHFENFAKQFS